MKKLPEPSENRTEVNELYKAIKRTPNNFLKQIQNLESLKILNYKIIPFCKSFVTNIKQKGKFCRKKDFI